MFPSSRMLVYNNETIRFNATFTKVQYNPIYTTRSESGYCWSDDLENIWVLGGVNGATFYKNFWLYTSSTDTWRELAPFISVRSTSGMCYVPEEDCVYTFGGSTNQPSLSYQRNDLYKYSVQTNTWSVVNPVNSAPPARIHCNMEYYNSKLYLFGSYNLGDLWEFDLSTLQWTQLQSAPYVKKYSTNTVQKDGNIYAIGSNDGTVAATGNAYIMQYNIDSGTWSVVSSTQYKIGKMVFYRGLLISLGIYNGTIYQTDLTTTFTISNTQNDLVVDNPVFVPTKNGILSVYGKNSGGTSLNLIYKIK